jgi:hypothetical protein
MDLNEFNNTYSINPISAESNITSTTSTLSGIYSGILLNTSGISGISGNSGNSGISIGNSTTGNTDLNRDFDAYIMERESFLSVNNNNTNLYNRIFTTIRNKIFILNEEETVQLDPDLVQEFNHKYSMEYSTSFINDFKAKIVLLYNRKLEFNITFEENKRLYSQFTDNIMNLTKNISETNNNSAEDEQLIELLTMKIEWYYNKLNLDSLKKEIDSINQEYEFVKGLLAEFAGFIPATVCQICLERQIGYFIDECGHTLCSECMDKSKGIRKCHFCRKTINSFKRLYL